MKRKIIRNNGYWFRKTSFISAARITLGALFVYASIDKLFNPAAFVDILYNYQILPDRLINLTVIVLPWLEWFVGICLLLNIFSPGAVVLVNLLLVTFFSAVMFNFARGLDISCGCFSTDAEGPMSILTILRDGFFLILSVSLLLSVFVSEKQPSETKKENL